MALVLNEDQQLLKDSAQSFCQQLAPVSLLRRLRDSKDETGFDRDVWKQMVDLGWAGMAIPEAYGGYGFGYGGLGVVLEETGRTLVSSPLISTVLLAATAINELGSEEQKQELLPKIVAGELLVALALDENSSHAPSRIGTKAEKSGDGFILSGAKTFVLDGHVAQKLIVVARSSGEIDSRQGLSLFLVDAGLEGIAISRTHMVDCRNAAKIEFSQVEVAADALLGEVDAGFDGLDKVLDIARIGLAAEMLGSIQEVFERILDFLKTREQFGILIGSFQGLQHRAATMYSEIELCKSVVRAALAGLDDSGKSRQDIAELASIAKAKLSEVFFEVSNEGIQMHGGIGMTDEFDIGFFLKRARVAQHFLGDASFHRDRYASLNNF
ncbi:MAG: acyl-CoA dehydrogenase family protein [Pseudomonadales bacterium]|jgi:alkylation response protein AidB-like acyl-CoA dehydrogenase|nr:acyl-CoA dehydrogenase family protein [Pseudomonadales bacterium]